MHRIRYVDIVGNKTYWFRLFNMVTLTCLVFVLKYEMI